MLTSRHVPAFLLIALVSISAASANVTVKRTPADIQYKTFDPANPPAEMPHLTPPEAAVTTSKFDFQAKGDPELVSRKRGEDGTWTVVVAVHRVVLTLQLHVVVWVPQGAPEKLKAHEEGHRKLAEKIYMERGEGAARAAAAVLDNRRLTGQGADWKSAADNAVQTAVEQVSREYLSHTVDVSNEVSSSYDEITVHGSNNVPEDKAMREALDRYEQNHPASQPAGKGGIKKE